jgi:hypothetical protein
VELEVAMMTDLSAEVALGKGCSRRKEKRVSRTGGLFSAPPLAAAAASPGDGDGRRWWGAGGVWALGEVALESPHEGLSRAVRCK